MSDPFWPPFCPNRSCEQSTLPKANGFFRHGHYTTRNRTQRIPRFLCRSCRRTMSSQTFDASYRLRHPDLEEAILRELAQGSSMRKVAKVLGINRKTVTRRLMRARQPNVIETGGRTERAMEREPIKGASAG